MVWPSIVSLAQWSGTCGNDASISAGNQGSFSGSGSDPAAWYAADDISVAAPFPALRCSAKKSLNPASISLTALGNTSHNHPTIQIHFTSPFNPPQLTHAKLLLPRNDRPKRLETSDGRTGSTGTSSLSNRSGCCCPAPIQHGGQRLSSPSPWRTSPHPHAASQRDSHPRL